MKIPFSKRFLSTFARPQLQEQNTGRYVTYSPFSPLENLAGTGIAVNSLRTTSPGTYQAGAVQQINGLGAGGQSFEPGELSPLTKDSIPGGFV